MEPNGSEGKIDHIKDHFSSGKFYNSISQYFIERTKKENPDRTGASKIMKTMTTGRISLYKKMKSISCLMCV